MSDVDIRALLDVPAEKIKKPPTLPPGHYNAFIEKFEPGRSREKQTPFLRLFFRAQSAGPDVDPARLKNDEGAELDLAKKQFRKDYYLTDDSKYRLKDMMEAVGIEFPPGKSLLAGVSELTMKPVMIELIEKPSDDGTEMYNEVKDVLRAAS